MFRTHGFSIFIVLLMGCASSKKFRDFNESRNSEIEGSQTSPGDKLPESTLRIYSLPVDDAIVGESVYQDREFFLAPSSVDQNSEEERISALENFSKLKARTQESMASFIPAGVATNGVLLNFLTNQALPAEACFSYMFDLQFDLFLLGSVEGENNVDRFLNNSSRHVIASSGNLCLNKSSQVHAFNTFSNYNPRAGGEAYFLQYLKSKGVEFATESALRLANTIRRFTPKRGAKERLSYLDLATPKPVQLPKRLTEGVPRSQKGVLAEVAPKAEINSHLPKPQDTENVVVLPPSSLEFQMKERADLDSWREFPVGEENSVVSALRAVPKADSYLEVLRQLGNRQKLAGGAFGEIFEVKIANKDVVVKVLSQGTSGGDLVPIQREEISKEAQVMSFLAAQKSTYFPQFYGAIKCKGFGASKAGEGALLFMEKFPTDLGSLLKEGSTKQIDPIPNKAQFTEELMQAVSDLHEKYGIAHNDLKPANILIRYDNEGLPHPVLADFGLTEKLGQEVIRGNGSAFWSDYSHIQVEKSKLENRTMSKVLQADLPQEMDLEIVGPQRDSRSVAFLIFSVFNPDIVLRDFNNFNAAFRTKVRKLSKSSQSGAAQNYPSIVQSIVQDGATVTKQLQLLKDKKADGFWK